MFQSMIPPMLEVIGQTIQAGNNDNVIKQLEVFDAMLILVLLAFINRNRKHL